MKVPVKNFSVL